MAPTPQPPRGMRDFLPADKARRDAVMGRIRSTFAAYGYQEIETPVAEDLARLTAGQGGDNEKLVFKILRRGLDAGVAIDPAEAADLGLRFDLTVPLTRFYATHRAELPAVFRSIQLAPVWRAERPQKGRYRQFTQCDIDVVGEAGEVAEVELLVATLDAFGALGIEGTTVRLNDRRILTGLLDACGFDPSAQGAVLITVDKLDKIGLAGVVDELRTSHDAAAVTALAGALEPFSERGEHEPPNEQTPSVGATLDLLPPGVEPWAAGLVRIDEAVRAVSPGARLAADPTLVRGMGYYTGPIYELSHPGSGSSVGGGGRYDGMVGRLTGTDVPACGSSIGFERVVDLVDPARLGTDRRRVALVHDPAVEPARLVGWQRRLVGEGQGTEVRLVARARNAGRQLTALTAEGFASWVSAGPELPDPGDPSATVDLRPLRA